MILFHQFFDQTSSTLTYLLADPLSGDAVIIDSVKEHLGAYLTFLQEQELQLAWVLETHVHADHVTGAAGLREMTGARSAVSAVGGVLCADRQLIDGDTIVFGSEVIRVMLTLSSPLVFLKVLVSCLICIMVFPRVLHSLGDICDGIMSGP